MPALVQEAGCGCGWDSGLGAAWRQTRDGWVVSDPRQCCHSHKACLLTGDGKHTAQSPERYWLVLSVMIKVKLDDLKGHDWRASRQTGHSR